MLIHKLLIEVRLVVEAVNVYCFGIAGEGGAGVVIAGCCEAGGIFPVAEVREAVGNVPFFRPALLSAFITYAPEYYAGMVPVTADHCREVFFHPFIEESCIAVLLLGNGPGVREFVHYKEAHTVTHVK